MAYGKIRGERKREKLKLMFKFEPKKAIEILLAQFPDGLNIGMIATNLAVNHITVKKYLDKYNFKFRKIGKSKLYEGRS